MRARKIGGFANPVVLAATVFAGVTAVLGFLVVPAISDPVADMYIEPAGKTVPIGETFTIDIMVRSTVPSNVFAGELLFDSEILRIDEIDYNISVADLWAERPWYSNGAGTLNFVGGTTRQGGFVGNNSLITVTFETLGEGDSTIQITDPHILRHDGRGTEVPFPEPLEQIFTVEQERMSLEPVSTDAKNDASSVRVVTEPPTTDLNGDGKQSVADVSIFMLKIGSDDPRYDFNLDGEVSIKDLGILMSTE